MALRRRCPNGIIVAQLGDTSNELYEVAESDRNLYLLGAMGMVIPVALGIALSTELPVIAVEGDGGCLMNLGTLTTTARYGPPNLSVLILDNEQYGSTGGQASATGTGANLAAIAAGCGIRSRVFKGAESTHTLVSWLLQPGTRLAVAKTAARTGNSKFVPLPPQAIAKRVRDALQGRQRGLGSNRDGLNAKPVRAY